MNNCDEIKNIGESLAYTSKGLFRTADILRIEYKALLGVSILLSLLTLAFDMNIACSKALSIISIFCTVWVLVEENSQQKVSEYMKLGNEFLALYSEVERLFCNNMPITDEIRQKREELNSKTANLSISYFAKKWVERTVGKEMNLEWVYSKQPD